MDPPAPSPPDASPALPVSPARPWQVGVLAFAALYWLLDLVVLGAGTPGLLDDTWEYGVVARSLLEGHGFRTAVIHPPLWTLRDASGTVPLLVHGPLLPALIAPILALFGPRALDHVAVLAALFAWGAAAQLFRVAERRFGAAVAAAAAALFTVSPLTLRAVHHDPALALGAWLLLLTLDLLARPSPRAVAGGLVLGAATLMRPEFLAGALLLPLLRGRAVRAAVGFVAVMLPWWIHCARSTGSPFFSLSSYLLIGYGGGRVGLSPMRDFSLAPDHWRPALWAALPHLPPKWMEALPHVFKRALLAPTGGTGWLAVAGAIVALRDPRTRGFAWLGCALAALPLVVMTTTVYDSRYLVPFLPLWSIAAALGASALAGALPPWGRRPRAWIGLLVLIALPSVAPAVKEASVEAPRLAARIREERALIARTLAPPDRASEAREPAPSPPTDASAEVVLTDTPDFVSWSSRRSTVWMTMEEYEALPECLPDGGSPTSDRPCRGPERLTWFHASAIP